MEFVHGLHQENTFSHKELLIRCPQGREKKNKADVIARIVCVGTNERTNERLWSSETKAVVRPVDGRVTGEGGVGV